MRISVTTTARLLISSQKLPVSVECVWKYSTGYLSLSSRRFLSSVMYADLAGFTAWSSVREPSQVFALLEAVYKTFDELANRRQVFKVETVGDCYVAVTGLPESRRDHAIAMARFARDCIVHMRVMTKQLEITLGPDTGDLHIRIGMHSGPVTAGVLRGARSRFQLFGDTVAMASRMERTGEKGRIHISQETAELLIGGGRGEWVKLREGKVAVNEAHTYWLSLQPGRRSETSSVPSSNEFENSMASVHYSEPDEVPLDSDMSAVEAHAKNKATISQAKMNRLIEWNVDVLHRLLRQVVARRSAIGIPPGVSLANERVERKILFSNGQVIDEVKEIIHLPRFNAQAARRQEDPDAIDIPQTVLNQLYDLVAVIADMYNQNPFHNFEHSSHVTMSVVKLLSRIVAPSDLEELGAVARSHLWDYFRSLDTVCMRFLSSHSRCGPCWSAERTAGQRRSPVGVAIPGQECGRTELGRFGLALVDGTCVQGTPAHNLRHRSRV